MAAKRSSFLNMFITLAAVTLVAALALGFVYEWTKAPIEKAKLEKQAKAIRAVVTGYDNDPVAGAYKVPAAGGGDSLEFFPARKDGRLIGTAVKTFSPGGYSGDIWLMVGLAGDGTILNIAVIQHAETPGLGSKMSAPAFMDQFLNLNPGEHTLKVTKDGGEIDAISGATITSRAFAEAIQRAYDTYKAQPHEN